MLKQGEIVTITDEKTRASIPVDRTTVLNCVAEHLHTIEFLQDIHEGMVVLSFEDYRTLPATLFDAMRIYRKVRKEFDGDSRTRSGYKGHRTIKP